jgi:DNA polymerase V
MALSGRAFPSPAAEYLQPVLNLQDFVVEHPTSTFFARASADLGFDIWEQDLLVIDRSLTPADGALVLVVREGQFAVRQLSVKEPVQVWGVITYILHKT